MDITLYNTLILFLIIILCCIVMLIIITLSEKLIDYWNKNK